MKRYEVKVEEVKTTVFELDAKNKKEAQAMVEEIIFKTCILEMNCVDHTKAIYINIDKIKKGKR